MGKKKTYGLAKEERLSSKVRIDTLFSEGKSYLSYPLRVVFLIEERALNLPTVSILISIPKRKIKVAPKRNRMKRLIKEAYRLNKSLFIDAIGEEQRVDIAFLFLPTELVNYLEIEKSIIKASSLLKSKNEVGK